jgi:hypothetical protein
MHRQEEAMTNTDEKESTEERNEKYRLVELELEDGTFETFEANPENCDAVYNDPRPEVQRLLALTYEGALPASRKMVEKEGYRYRPSKSFHTGRWPTYKAKVAGIKGLVEIERTPANLAREFDCSESSIRRALEKERLI